MNLFLSRWVIPSLVLSIAWLGVVSAQDYYQFNNLLPTGNWNTTDPNWDANGAGSFNSAWSNGNGNNLAAFTAVSGPIAITVTAPINVNAIQAGSDDPAYGVTINTGSGGSLTFTQGTGGTTPAIYLMGQLTINSALAGTRGLTVDAFSGTGSLTLSGSNSALNTIAINSGNVTFTTPAALPGLSGRTVTINGPGTAAAGYAIDQAFLDRIVTTSGGSIGVAVNSPNNLDMTGFATTSLGGARNSQTTYSGTLTPDNNTYRLGGAGTLSLTQPLKDNNAVPRSLLVTRGNDPFTPNGGNVILTGINTFTGGTTVFGNLTVGNGVSGASMAGNVLLQSSGSNPVYGKLDFNSPGLTFGGTISGSGYVGIFANTTLSGANTHLGTDIASGTLKLGNANALGSSLSFSGPGTLDLNGFAANTGSITSRVGGTISNTSASPAALSIGNSSDPYFEFNGTITQSGGAVSLVKNGSSNLFLSGANTYTGGTTINGGKLILTIFQTTGSILGNVTITSPNAGFGFEINNFSNAYTFGGNISGTGFVQQANYAGGTTILTGTNTYTGGTYIPTGVLQFNSPSAIGGTGRSVEISGGTAAAGYAIDQAFLDRLKTGSTGTAALSVDSANNLNFSGFANLRLGAATNETVTYSGTPTPNGSTLLVGGGGGTLTISTNLAGSYGLNMDMNTNTTSGRVILTGTNSYSGGTMIDSGVLQFNSPAAIAGSGRTVTVNYAGTAVAGYAIDQAFLNRIDAASNGTVQINSDSGTNLDMSAFTGTLSLGGANIVYSGAVMPGANTYRFGGGNGTITVTQPLLDNGATPRSLVVNGGGTGGTVVLTGANSYSGGTVVTAGTLKLGNASALGASGGSLNLVIEGSNLVQRSILDLNGYSATVGKLEGFGTVTNSSASAVTLTVGNGFSGTTTFSGSIQEVNGTIALVKTGPGELVLANFYNNYSGGNTVQQGRLTYSVSIGGAPINIGNVGIAAGAEFSLQGSLNYAGNIGGAGTLIIGSQGSGGYVTLSGTNTQTGGTVVAGSTVFYSSPAAMGGGGSNIQVNPGAAVSPLFAINQSFLNRIGTGSNGAIVLNQDSSANLDMSAFTGTLSLGAFGATYSGTITPAANTYRLGRAGNVYSYIAVTQPLMDNGATPRSLVVAGGTVILRGVNTYTGGTTILAGQLIYESGTQVSFGQLISGSGTIYVGGTAATGINNNGTISGTSPTAPLVIEGYANGSGGYNYVVFNGTYSPGNSPAQVPAGDITYGPQAIALMEIGGTQRGTQYDAIVSTGKITFDGTLKIQFLNGFTPANGTTFDLFDFNSASGQFQSFDLPALSPGLEWNIANVSTNGTVSITPEPASALAAAIASLAAVRWVRRRRS